MHYHCKICGEPLMGNEIECPNCHTAVKPATVVETRPVHAIEDESNTHRRKDAVLGKPCPRCGEMLLPGANVCEFCGEVVGTVGRSDQNDRFTTQFAAPPVDEEKKLSPEELPPVIKTNTVKAADTPLPGRNATVPFEAAEKPKAQKHGQVTMGMLIVICVLTAVVAGCITWAVIHFTRSSSESDTTEEETYTATDGFASTDPSIGAEETVDIPPVTMPDVNEEKTDVVDGDDVPIEGMRESLAGSWTFYGKVNNKFSIGIDMKVEPDGSISGCYWYDSTLRQNGDEPSTYINIEGEVDDTGKVKLTTYKYGENTPAEHWIGRLKGVKPLRFDGSFKSATKGTTYTFSTATR